MADTDEDYEIITDTEIEAVREFSENLETHSMSSAVEGIQKYFDQLHNVNLNIGITGESGAGKSSFVNALRGLGDDEELSAPTGVTETTMESTSYPYPKSPNVVLWDLPGIGTPNFKADEYLEKVDFHRYDFFILIASERFKNSSVDLAKEIKKMKKNFYFVRSKLDDNIRAERRKKNFDQKKVLDQIRQDCVKGLGENGIESPKVFLISSHELGNFDFNLLQQTMESELPKHKRETLLLALPVLTLKIYQKKREALRAKIWKLALLSGGVAAVPIPGLSICADLGILVTEIRSYYQAFGLDDQSLENLSRQTEVPIEEFKACLKSPLTKEISTDVVLKILTKVAGGGVMVATHFMNLLPLGSVPAAGLSLGTTYKMLNRCLEELAKDALAVLQKALPQTSV